MTWARRSRELPDGTVERWRERPKPGCPGVVERHYVEAADVFRARRGEDALRLVSGAPRSMRERSASRSSSPRRATSASVLVDTARLEPLAPSWRLGEKPVSVFLTGPARRQLSREDWDDGFEAGGALFGTWRPQGRELRVADLTGNGDLPAAATTFQLNWAYVTRMQRRHAQATGWTLLGGWHSHPTWPDDSPREAEPSRGDLEAWAARYQAHARQDCPFWLGLIVARSVSGGIEPQIRAWTVGEEDGELVARGVSVEVAAGWDV